MSNPALYVSAASLLISAATFWVTNRRLGRLVIVDGPAYSLSVADDRVILYLALSFTNTGVRPWPIRDLRIVAPEISRIPLTWLATLNSIPGSQGDPGRKYPSGLVVGPRSTELRIMEFQSDQAIVDWPRTKFTAEVLIQPSRAKDRSYVRAATLLIKTEDGGEYGLIAPHGNGDDPNEVGIVDKCPGLARPRAD
jgi:hypothetical protein